MLARLLAPRLAFARPAAAPLLPRRRGAYQEERAGHLRELPAGRRAADATTRRRPIARCCGCFSVSLSPRAPRRSRSSSAWPGARRAAPAGGAGHGTGRTGPPRRRRGAGANEEWRGKPPRSSSRSSTHGLPGNPAALARKPPPGSPTSSPSRDDLAAEFPQVRLTSTCGVRPQARDPSCSRRWGARLLRRHRLPGPRRAVRSGGGPAAAATTACPRPGAAAPAVGFSSGSIACALPPGTASGDGGRAVIRLALPRGGTWAGARRLSPPPASPRRRDERRPARPPPDTTLPGTGIEVCRSRTGISALRREDGVARTAFVGSDVLERVGRRSPCRCACMRALPDCL